MRSISVGPVSDLSFIQSENIKSVKSAESDNPKKPFCLCIEFHNGKSKMIYFLIEDEANRNLKKVKTEMQKVFKNNNFQKILPEVPKVKIRKNKKSELEEFLYTLNHLFCSSFIVLEFHFALYDIGVRLLS